MISVTIVLLLLAFVCFLAAALVIPARVNLVALGLALWVATLLLGRALPGERTTELRVTPNTSYADARVEP